QSMLAKKPNQRLQSGAAVAAALEPYCSNAAPAAIRPAANNSADVRFVEPRIPAQAQFSPAQPPSTSSSPFRFDSKTTTTNGRPERPKGGGKSVLLLSGAGAAVVVACGIGLALLLAGSRPKATPTSAAHVPVVETIVPPQSPEEILAAAVQDDASAVMVIRAG